jgi:DNA repair exonuclease SbcCD ATPase subunit
LAEERDFAALIGRTGYLGSIFDEVLEDIGQRASSIMSSLPNVSHCSIKLRSTKVTKAGEKRAITPTIFIDGAERPLQGCSGGMTSSITLAVDLAVGEVIADRTGARPGWLILDECFDGMDPVTKEACLELLRDTAEKDGILILVIDHGAELKEMFEKVVTVAFQNGRSWIDTSAITTT